MRWISALARLKNGRDLSLGSIPRYRRGFGKREEALRDGHRSFTERLGALRMRGGWDWCGSFTRCGGGGLVGEATAGRRKKTPRVRRGDDYGCLWRGGEVNRPVEGKLWERGEYEGAFALYFL